MLLYHYSKERYDVLKTRRLSHTFSASELVKIKKRTEFTSSVGMYIDHISFFFDPIPSALLGDIFDKDHSAWFPGSKLYEYVIDSKELSNLVAYDVVETPEELVVFDRVDWPDNDPAFARQYFRDRARRTRHNRTNGTRYLDLLEQIRKYQGTTKEHYRKAVLRDDWYENRLKYAANVPHLMVYPKGGEVSYFEIRELTIGSDERSVLA